MTLSPEVSFLTIREKSDNNWVLELKSDSQTPIQSHYFVLTMSPTHDYAEYSSGPWDFTVVVEILTAEITLSEEQLEEQA